jgi:hypothetical protein
MARSTEKARADENGDGALRRDVEERLEALRVVNELRAPLWDAVRTELDAATSKGKSSFSRRAAATRKRVTKARQAFSAGELTRARAIKSYERGLAELRADFEDRSVDALWKHAKLHPPLPELLMAWLGRRIGDEPHALRIDKHLGLLYEHLHERPEDIGVIEQGLGGDPGPAPQPFGTCVMPPYTLNDDRLNAQLISDNLVMSRPFFGVATCDVGGATAGGASGYSLVGADFDVPAGHTTVAATATLVWSFYGMTFAIGGGAAAGASLLMRVEDPIGTVVSTVTTPLFSLLSAVTWGNEARGSSTSVLRTSIATSDGAARTVRVFAGVAAHAECGAAFAAGATADSGATVPTICVTAT